MIVQIEWKMLNKITIITKKTKTNLGLGQTVQSPLSPPPPHRLYHPPPTNTRHPGSTDDLSLSLTQPHVCRPASNARPNSPIKLMQIRNTVYNGNLFDQKDSFISITENNLLGELYNTGIRKIRPW